MIPEWGNLALMLALGLSIIQFALPLAGAIYDRKAWMIVAKPAALSQCLLIFFSVACLMYAFVTHDFSVNYVSANSAFSLPLHYRIAAMWGGHEGSLLLWLLVLNTWIIALILWHTLWGQRLELAMLARILSVLGLINVGFLWFMLATSNPFIRSFTSIPLEGKDLNPLLQDPGLIFHPPMLYVGYVGYAVVFAFAVAALLAGNFNREWAQLMRPWALLAWLSLTLGIVLGSWWAYRELGWGGFWFWDPVENASLLPWFIGTALLHSLSATQKRGVFKTWSVLLSILAFALSLLGTFLVRSGVLVSVHAFANDPERGAFLLEYLFVIVGSSLLLFAWRAGRFKTEQGFDFLSKETFILANNLILTVMMLTILVGTLYPLVLDVLGLGKISVGSPYFNSVFIPLAIPLFLLMGAGPLCYWHNMSPRLLFKQICWIFAVSLALGLTLPWILTQEWAAWVALGVTLSFWIILATLQYLLRIVQSNKRGLKSISAGQYGMSIAHIGVAVVILGVTVVSHFGVERDIRMRLNETVSVAGYDYTFSQLSEHDGPNYQALRASFIVHKKGQLVTKLDAEKRFYTVSRMPMAEVALQAGFLRDLYMVLGENFDDGSWSVRIYYKPFVFWIWLGGVLMVLGGVVATLDSRYRRALEKTAIPAN
jgi:cytochrome c-type biogenesis protein CcmF